jgi:hypothetical protein
MCKYESRFQISAITGHIFQDRCLFVRESLFKEKCYFLKPQYLVSTAVIEALANEHTVDSASLRSDKKQQYVEEQVMPKSVHENDLFLEGHPFEKGLK